MCEDKNAINFFCCLSRYQEVPIPWRSNDFLSSTSVDVNKQPLYLRTNRAFSSEAAAVWDPPSLSPPTQPHHHSAELVRMMTPTDANVAGNTHGGTIMQLMEESAGVAANRYFNHSHRDKSRVCAVTSRVERMTFLHPVHVGDVAKAHAEVVFASQHTVAVSVTVTAERMAWSSSTRDEEEDSGLICNRALVWLTGVVLPGDSDQASVQKTNPKYFARALAPPFPIPNQETNPVTWKAYKRAAQAYETRKHSAAAMEDDSDSDCDSDGLEEDSSDMSALSPDDSAVELVQVMLPSDCTTQSGLVGGGVVMKLMDNASGVAAVRHCGTNVVTIAVDGVNFEASVVLKVKARPTFSSSKSIEMEVSVVAERFLPSNGDGALTRHEIVTTQRAYFTFVSLPSHDDHQAPVASLPMRPLRLRSDRDRAIYAAGKRRYEQRKLERQSRTHRS